MSRTKLTEEQSTKIIDWITQNIKRIRSEEGSNEHWSRQCGKELGFDVTLDMYRNRKRMVENGTLPEYTRYFREGNLNNDNVTINRFLEIAAEIDYKDQLNKELQAQVTSLLSLVTSYQNDINELQSKIEHMKNITPKNYRQFELNFTIPQPSV